MSGESVTPKGIHHVELLVGNAKQAAYFYRKAFGFSQMAYAGLFLGISWTLLGSLELNGALLSSPDLCDLHFHSRMKHQAPSQ